MTLTARKYLDLVGAVDGTLHSVNPNMIVSLESVTDDDEDGTWVCLADGRRIQMREILTDILKWVEAEIY